MFGTTITQLCCIDPRSVQSREVAGARSGHPTALFGATFCAVNGFQESSRWQLWGHDRKLGLGETDTFLGSDRVSGLSYCLSIMGPKAQAHRKNMPLHTGTQTHLYEHNMWTYLYIHKHISLHTYTQICFYAHTNIPLHTHLPLLWYPQKLTGKINSYLAFLLFFSYWGQ